MWGVPEKNFGIFIFIAFLNSLRWEEYVVGKKEKTRSEVHFFDLKFIFFFVIFPKWRQKNVVKCHLFCDVTYYFKSSRQTALPTKPAKEVIVQLPPKSTEVWVEIELIFKHFDFDASNNMPGLFKAASVILHGLTGLHCERVSLAGIVWSWWAKMTEQTIGINLTIWSFSVPLFCTMVAFFRVTYSLMR